METNEFDVEEERSIQDKEKRKWKGRPRTKTDADVGQAGTGSMRTGKCGSPVYRLVQHWKTNGRHGTQLLFLDMSM